MQFLLKAFSEMRLINHGEFIHPDFLLLPRSTTDLTYVKKLFFGLAFIRRGAYNKGILS